MDDDGVEHDDTKKPHNDKDKRRAGAHAASGADGPLLSDDALDRLLKSAPFPPSAPGASDALQRAILDDFDAVTAQNAARAGSSSRLVKTLRDGLSGLFVPDLFVGGAARLAAAGVMGVVATTGFMIGVQINSGTAPGAVAHAVAVAGLAEDEDEDALAYFTMVLDETAFYGEGDSLWRAD